MEHVGQRNLGRDGLHVTTFTKVSNKTTTRVDISQNISHIFFRSGDIDLHHGFHKAGLGLSQTFTGGCSSGNFKSHHGRIDIVVSSINQSGFQAQNRVSGNDTSSENRFNTLLHTRNIFLGHISSLNFRDEFEVRGIFIRVFLGLELNLDTSILTRTSRLFLVCVVHFGGRSDSLTVGHLGSTNIGFNVELTLHSVNNNFKVEFSHAFNDGLTGFFVTRESERRILGGKTNKGVGHFLLVALGLGFHSNLDDGFREFHFFEDDSLILVTQSFSGCGILEANKGNDITSNSTLNFSTVVGVHLKHTSDTFVLSLNRVVDSASSFHNTRVDTGESQGTNKRIGGDLEGKGGERFDIRRVTDNGFTVFINTLDSFDINGGRHVADNCIQKGLDTLVLESSTGENRNERQSLSSLADQSSQSFSIGFNTFEVFHENIFVLFDGDFNELFSPFSGLGLELIINKRNIVTFIKRDNVETGTKVFPTPDDRFHSDEVNHTQEIGFGSDGQLKDGRGGSKKVNDGVNTVVKVSSSSVHLVQEAHTRNFVLVGLSPDGFGLGFNTGHTVEHSDGSIQNTKGTLHFQSEIDVSWSINDVDSVVFPCASCGSRRNGDTTFLFLFHPVHGGSTFVDFSDFVRLSSVVQDTFGGGGLSGINVRHDTNVTVHGKLDLTERGRRSLLKIDILGLVDGAQDLFN